MTVLVFANRASTTVSSGGTSAPASGTIETWTVASGTTFPALAAGQAFAAADPAAPSEIAWVTAMTGASNVTWTVTRGAEGTTPIAHAAGFTAENVITAAFLSQAQQSAPNAVTFTIDGTKTPGYTGAAQGDFTPWVTLATGSTATVTWVFPDGTSATGIKPTIDWSTTQTYTVRMTVTDTLGRDAVGDVIGINCGYDSTLDSSSISLGPAYDWNDHQTTFTGISNLQCLVSLQYFMAEYSGLGAVNTSSLGALAYLELYGSASLTSLVVGGNPSLIRVDAEACDLATLDLEPIAGSIQDSRGAVQSGGYHNSRLQLSKWSTPRARQFHYCFRDQDLIAPPDFSLLPHVVQQWFWNTGWAGDFRAYSPNLNSLLAYANSIRTADLTASFAVGTYGKADLHANALSSINITGCRGLNQLIANSNPLLQAEVDSILSEADSWGTWNGTLNLSGTSQPSSAGQSSVTSLQGKGWTVTVDTAPTATKFSPADSVLAICDQTDYTAAVTLAKAVNAGDLLVGFVHATAAPTVTDSAGNTWTVVKGGSYGYLAYCLSSLAASGGLTVTASVTGTNIHSMGVDRFLTASAASFGAAATNGSGTTGGLHTSTADNLGTFAAVPAGALVWGAFASDSSTGDQYFFPGFQDGTSGTVANIGTRSGLVPPEGTAEGCAFTEFVPVATAGAAALTWYGTGTDAAGTCYVSAYFT